MIKTVIWNEKLKVTSTSGENMTRRIGLALSGGGFRATLFHLGVIRFLNEVGVLKDVTHICSVSGGSILAAHLVLHWDKYTSKDHFDEVAEKVIDFARMDLRGKIVRRYMFSWINAPLVGLSALRWGCFKVIPRIGVFLSRYKWGKSFRVNKWRPENLLQYYYQELYDGKRMGELSKHPELLILSTSMTTGEVCSFSQQGFMRGLAGKGLMINTGQIPVAFAVAASSAFPPLFPPLEVNREVLMCSYGQFPNPDMLTDGGIYDNLGVGKLYDLWGSIDEDDKIIVSDAGGLFDLAVNKTFSLIVPRATRASDILMNRVTEFMYSHLQEDTKGRAIHCRIGKEVHRREDPTVIDEGAQRMVAMMRTDLNEFSSAEIDSLIRHGYAVARAEWRRCATEHKTGELINAPWSPISSSQFGENQADTLRESSYLALGLWNKQDKITYVNYFVLPGLYLAALLCLIALPYLKERFEKKRLQEQTKVLANEAELLKIKTDYLEADRDRLLKQEECVKQMKQYAKKLHLPSPEPIVAFRRLEEDFFASLQNDTFLINTAELGKPGLPQYCAIMGWFVTKNYTRCVLGEKTEQSFFDHFRNSLVFYILITDPETQDLGIPSSPPNLSLFRIMKGIETRLNGSPEQVLRLALGLLVQFDCDWNRSNLLSHILAVNKDMHLNIPSTVITESFERGIVDWK